MLSPKRLVLLTLLFLILVFSFFYFVLSPSSGFYQITLVPTSNITAKPEAMSPLSKGEQGGLNPTVSPTKTPVIVAPTPDPITYYTVQSGDTLEKIAIDNKVSWIDLANLNQISDPNLLSVGQIIKISHDQSDYEAANPYYIADIYEAKENEKHILIVLSEQRLYTYEGDQLIGSYLISSGVASYPTVTGVFKVWIKLPSTTMSGGSGDNAYYLPGVKYTMYFYGDYGIHGTYWHNNFGTPMSHGCVNMSEADAEEVYNWADIGTIVQIVP